MTDDPPTPYMTLDELVHYSRTSRRQLERYMRDPIDPLRPFTYNGRRPLFLRPDVDVWFARRGPAAGLSAARSADEIIAEVSARVRARRSIDRTAVQPYPGTDANVAHTGSDDGWAERGEFKAKPPRKSKSP